MDRAFRGIGMREWNGGPWVPRPAEWSLGLTQP